MKEGKEGGGVKKETRGRTGEGREKEGGDTEGWRKTEEEER